MVLAFLSLLFLTGHARADQDSRSKPPPARPTPRAPDIGGPQRATQPGIGWPQSPSLTRRHPIGAGWIQVSGASGTATAGFTKPRVAVVTATYDDRSLAKIVGRAGFEVTERAPTTATVRAKVTITIKEAEGDPECHLWVARVEKEGQLSYLTGFTHGVEDTPKYYTGGPGNLTLSYQIG